MSVFLFILTGVCLLISGCEDTNLQLATEAGADAVRAVTLSDREVSRLAARASAESDRRHRMAGPESVYGRRLSGLVRNFTAEDRQAYDVRGYLSDQVNAFAMADGTIRIYSGLMDRMDDHEVLFVIGHEMGHVAENHSKKKLMMAYAASALRKGISSQENVVGVIAGSALGGFVEALANARFSRQEEQAADDYGLAFLKASGFDHEAAVDIAARALEKLASGAPDSSMLSSHPAPAKRAERMRAAPDRTQRSLAHRLMATGNRWVESARLKIRKIQREIQNKSESDNQ